MAESKEPQPIGQRGIPDGPAPGAEFHDYKVQTGDSLDAVAQRVGIVGLRLCDYNFRTTDPEEINWYLRRYVGCKQSTADGNNYVFDSGDTPGVLHLPVAYAKPAVVPITRAVLPNPTIRSTLVSEPPTMQVQELSFLDGLNLATWPGGALVDKLVWKSSANPDLAAAFVRGRKTGELKTKLKIKLLKGNHGATQFHVRGVGFAHNGHPAGHRAVFANGKVFRDAARDAMSERIVLQTKNPIAMVGNEMEVPDIVIKEGQLPDRVMICHLSLRWAYSYDEKTWVSMGYSGPHKLYLVEADPTAKLGARTDDQKLYDFGLEKACGYVNGDTNIPLALCKAIHSDPGAPKYDPGKVLSLTENPLKYYGSPLCLCWNYARLMEYLCHTLGVDASLTFVWGGADTTTWVEYAPHHGSFQVKAPDNHRAKKDPHFTYHAITKVGGTDYDATYGLEGTTKPVETAMRKEAGKLPKDWSTPYPRIVHTSFRTANPIDEGWTCPHPP